MSKDQISSLVWLSVALFACIESIRLPFGSWRLPGPGLFPFIAGIILVILSLMIFYQSCKRKSQEPRVNWYSKGKIKNVSLTLAALFLYAAILEFLGFIITTFLLLIFFFRFLSREKLILILGASVFISLLSYALFSTCLKAQLPRGIFGF